MNCLMLYFLYCCYHNPIYYFSPSFFHKSSSGLTMFLPRLVFWFIMLYDLRKEARRRSVLCKGNTYSSASIAENRMCLLHSQK